MIPKKDKNLNLQINNNNNTSTKSKNNNINKNSSSSSSSRSENIQRNHMNKNNNESKQKNNKESHISFNTKKSTNHSTTMTFTISNTLMQNFNCRPKPISIFNINYLIKFIYTITFASLLSSSLTSLALVSCSELSNMQNVNGNAPTAASPSSSSPPPPPPLAAALASPGGGAGGLGHGIGSGSSILEQFTPNCTAVSHIFQGRGIDAAEIPVKPKNEMGLRYCESSSVGTCCTFNMETKMAKESRHLLEKYSKEHITRVSNNLALKAQKFNEVFRNLLQDSKQEFHRMFTRTYGIIYQQNSYVFSDLFKELENYYSRGRVDLLKVMDKFFNTLYQKMFQVLNGQYYFDEKYLQCVSEYMKDLKPFGDVPDKLSNQIKRSFVATRTYGQALATAADVSKKLVTIRFNADCTAALTKMQNCGACKGYTEKPCVNYCVNVIKGCLHYFNEMDVEWENFVMAMDKVAERLLGSFNIVMVVEPINIKISEAIMNFQDNGHDITNRVMQGCGTPSLGRAKRSLNPKFNSLLGSSFPLALNKYEAASSALFNTVKQLEKRSASTINVNEEEKEDNEDILDIDANLDEAIVLRERRSAEASDDSTKDSATSTGPRANRKNNSNNSNNGGNQKKKQQQNRKNDNDFTGRDPALDKLVRDIRQRVKDSKKFWSNLPHQICSNENISSTSDADGMCWNGHTIDRYMHSVTTEHGSNPEFPGNPATPRQTSLVATQLHYLKNVITHLRNAYNGQDVDWNDQEEAYFGSGMGSGDGTNDDDEDDGDDGDDDDEGSGESPYVSSKPVNVDHTAGRDNHVDDEDGDVDEAPTAINTNSRNPSSAPGSTITTQTSRPKTHPSHDATNVDHNAIEENEYPEDDRNDESKSGGANKPQKMSLRRALLVYLLPLYMAWFGGFCAELL